VDRSWSKSHQEWGWGAVFSHHPIAVWAPTGSPSWLFGFVPFPGSELISPRGFFFPPSGPPFERLVFDNPCESNSALFLPLQKCGEFRLVPGFRPISLWRYPRPGIATFFAKHRYRAALNVRRFSHFFFPVRRAPHRPSLTPCFFFFSVPSWPRTFDPSRFNSPPFRSPKALPDTACGCVLSSPGRQKEFLFWVTILFLAQPSKAPDFAPPNRFSKENN